MAGRHLLRTACLALLGVLVLTAAGFTATVGRATVATGTVWVQDTAAAHRGRRSG